MIEVNFNFDDMEKAISEAERAGEELQRALSGLKFKPADDADVKRAIAEMKQIVEHTLGPYRSNGFIEPLIDATKETLRREILKQASEARRSGAA